MAQGPDPLPDGTTLAGRFQLGPVLGRGGFGITYLAEDLERGGQVAVKELAPVGATRSADGSMAFADDAAVSGRLRHQFLAEARLLERLAIRGVPQVRACLHENATSYYATEYIANAPPLSRVLLAEGRLDAGRVKRILFKLLDTLAALHRRGILHRDIKPANVLLRGDDDAFLIDFGSAREWRADMTVDHTVLVTPGYAPLEQMSVRARRGPATDLYALCATAYALLIGEPPPDCTERAVGAPLIPVRSLRKDVDEPFAAAIEAGLALRFEDRPQSAEAFVNLLEAPPTPPEGVDRVRDLDEKRLRLLRLRFGRRQCPACGGVLEEPKPLPEGLCPVCREDKITKRRVDLQTCPSCRIGILHKRPNAGPLRYCPTCHTGRLLGQAHLISLGPKRWTCEACGAVFEASRGRVRVPDGEWRPWDEMRRLSGRSAVVRECDLCHAQYDERPDGRWVQVTPKPEPGAWSALFPEEWANVAAGLDPGAGNAACERCGADFFLDGDNVTLLSKGHDDLYGFAEVYTGRLLHRSDLPWLGAGKQSGHAGLLCSQCGTEFDKDGGSLQLVRSDEKRLRANAGRSLTLENWHRVAQDLPLSGEEASLDAAMADALVEAYCLGEAPFDPRDDQLIWKGSASELKGSDEGEVEGKRCTLCVRGGMLTLSRVLWRRGVDLHSLADVCCDGDVLEVTPEGCDPWRLLIEPVQRTFNLESGREAVLLGAEHLARRIDAFVRR